MVGFGGEDSIVAIAWWSYGLVDASHWKWFYAFATGVNYAAELDKVQCAVTAHPAKFNVDVDLQLRTITVKPLATDDGVKNIEPSWVVAGRSAETAPGLSMIDTTYYTSVLGDMFLDSALP